jgi:1,6-anhydro-N-acetylmuramate kinase
MVYRVIGLVCGNMAEGIHIVFTELHENGGKWSYDVLQAASYTYPAEWAAKLENAVELKALDYSLLHTGFGQYLGTLVNAFIEKNDLHFKVALVAVKGYSAFHDPGQQLTAELGHGAVIAALTKLPVVTDIRALDTALGGKGAGWTAIAEKLLFKNEVPSSDSGLRESVAPTVPESDLIRNKQALSIALMGVLRWREDVNMLSVASGASGDSVGGAMWMGQET